MLYHSALVLKASNVDKLSDKPFNENFLTHVSYTVKPVLNGLSRDQKIFPLKAVSA